MNHSVLRGRRTFVIDTARSRFGFRAKAFGLRWVHGTLRVREAHIDLRDDLVAAEGIALAASVSTRLAPRDWHLRHPHYLHAAAHPEIRLVIPPTPVTATSTVATLSARGKSVELPLELISLATANDELHLHVAGRFDRTALGMLHPLGGVSRIVHVDFDVVASPQPAADGTAEETTA